MRLSLRSQLLLASVGGIALVCVAAIGGAYWSLSSDLNARTTSEIARAAACATAQLDDEMANLTRLGQAVASRPDLIRAVETDDRAAIREIARSIMTGTHVDVVTISDKTGSVMARGHSDKAGDSVLNQTVVARALRGEAYAGVEPGTVAPFIVRSGCPIRNGQHVVGVVTIGSDPFASHRFVDTIKRLFGVECTVFHQDKRISTTIMCDGERAIGTRLDNPTVMEQTLRQGKIYHGTGKIIGASYGVLYSPLRDAQGQIQGMLFLGRPSADIASTKFRLLQASIGLVALAALLAIAFSTTLADRITGPLRCLAQGLAEATQGKWDLTRRFVAHGDNEVAAATRSVNTLLEKLHDILRNVGKEAAQLSSSSADLSAAALTGTM